MVQFIWTTNNCGNFDFFYLPYHRKRTLPGGEGRLRFPVVIYSDDVGYESDAEEWHQDFAFRWSHYFGIFDIGLSHFYGTGRDIFFILILKGILKPFTPSSIKPVWTYKPHTIPFFGNLKPFTERLMPRIILHWWAVWNIPLAILMAMA